MIIDTFQLLSIVGVIVGLSIYIIMHIKGVPRMLAERDARIRGVQDRKEFIEDIGSDNRWYSFLVSGSLWIMGGGLLFGFFFTGILRAMGREIGSNIWILLVGCFGLYVLLGGRIIGKGLTWSRKMIGVEMTMAVSSDGRRTAKKEVLLEKVQEIGRFRKQNRAEYIGKLSIQFCEPFRKKLLRSQPYTELGEEIDWSQVEYKDLLWRPDEPDGTDNGDLTWDPQDFKWDEFCETECSGERCHFCYTRQMLVEENYWRIYEVYGKQFAPYHMWLYITRADWEKEFAQEEIQLSIAGWFWRMKGTRISCTLVEVAHTIDGKHPSGRPELVACPIFLITESPYSRQLIFQGITPEYMTATEMYRTLRDRPVPGALDAAIHVRRADATIQRVTQFKVATRREMEEYGENIIEKLMLAGKSAIKMVSNRALLAILIIVVIGAFLWLFFSGNLFGNGGEAATNSTQGLF